MENRASSHLAYAAISGDFSDIHQDAARRIVWLLWALSLVMAGATVMLFLYYTVGGMSSDAARSRQAVPDSLPYVILGIYVLTFSVLMATYRSHMSEVSKYQTMAIGFMRVQYALENSVPDVGGDIIKALTSQAFGVTEAKKAGRINSPIEGHPGSDFAAELLNKALDSVKVVRKKKKAAPASSSP